jgi:hypothetical protein
MAESTFPQFVRPNQGRRIDARPRNVEYEEGTGPGTGRTARRVDPGMGGGLDAFYLSQRYKDLPMSMINREANIRRGQGMMYNPYSGTYQRDSMYNRSGLGYGRGEMPQAQAQPQQPQQPAMSSQQQEWARMAAEKQGANANVGATGGAMQGLGKSMTGFNPMFGAGMQAAGAALNAASTGRSPTTPNPYLSTREQNIANAKAAGQFDKVRADYNKKNEATGMVMDEEGNITRSPEIAAKDRAAEKTMMSNLKRGVDYTTSGSTTSFTSPYGRGSITTSMAPGRPQSMVRDEFGRMVPMSPYLKEKDVTQRSQGMTGGSSVLGGNRPAANVIPSGTAQPKAATPIATPAKEQPKAPTAKAAETPKLIAESVDKKVAAEQKPLTPSEKRKLTLLENKYKAQGIASDEMKALDADRSAMMVGRNRLFQEIENQQETVTKGSPFGGRPYQYQKTLSPQELAEKVNQLEKLEEAIKENYKKSQELGNKRKIPEDVMKEWLELSSRANAR